MPPARVPLGVLDRVLLREAARAPHESYLHIGGAVVLTGTPPTAAELGGLVTAAVRRVPVLTYRLGGRWPRAWWEPDPGFDPAEHVEVVDAEPGEDAHRAVTRAVATRPLRRDRPLWGLLLVRGCADGYALCYRAHHAFQDGVAAGRTAAALLGASRLPAPRPVEPGPPVAAVTKGVPDLLRLARRAGRLPEQPTGPRDPHLVRLDADLFGGAGATVFQVVLAALATALHDWGPGPGPGPVPRRGLGAVVPVSVHPAGSCLGNRVVLIPVDLPAAEPAACLARVVAQTRLPRLARCRAARGLVDRMPLWTARLVAAVLRWAWRGRIAVTAVRAGAALPGEVFPVPPMVPPLGGLVAVVHGGSGVVVSLEFPGRRDVDELGRLLHRAVVDLGRLDPGRADTSRFDLGRPAGPGGSAAR
ncbi:wax ester/triacylglycerol synthase domain-containing protein [Saccharothrix syringae]|uniref:wax ester/triacylglycerol synthase domain-containing protein n=1 Tax=Saccharothrix syringae TaxID=103733 RepID=UPI00068F4D78|nr:wax ester/triacylglycerol synthase domain-containing protein [Saccharothrix syringae]